MATPPILTGMTTDPNAAYVAGHAERDLSRRHARLDRILRDQHEEEVTPAMAVAICSISESPTRSSFSSIHTLHPRPSSDDARVWAIELSGVRVADEHRHRRASLASVRGVRHGPAPPSYLGTSDRVWRTMASGGISQPSTSAIALRPFQRRASRVIPGRSPRLRPWRSGSI